MSMKPHARPAYKSDETPEFREFWEKIWRPIASEYDGRALARDRFFFHVWFRDANPQDIVDAARYYERNGGNREKKLLAANWLDRGRYEDDAERERDFQRRSAELASKPSNITTFPKGQTAFLRQQKQG